MYNKFLPFKKRYFVFSKHKGGRIWKLFYYPWATVKPVKSKNTPQSM